MLMASLVTIVRVGAAVAAPTNVRLLETVLAPCLMPAISASTSTSPLPWMNCTRNRGQQTLNCFPRHRTRNDVAPDHDLVHVRSTNILEHSLERGKVGMNIINCSNPHKIRRQRSEVRNPRLRFAEAAARNSAVASAMVIRECRLTGLGRSIQPIQLIVTVGEGRTTS